jgi:hypothetical protein
MILIHAGQQRTGSFATCQIASVEFMAKGWMERYGYD